MLPKNRLHADAGINDQFHGIANRAVGSDPSVGGKWTVGIAHGLSSDRLMKIPCRRRCRLTVDLDRYSVRIYLTEGVGESDAMSGIVESEDVHEETCHCGALCIVIIRDG